MIRVENVSKIYTLGTVKVTALRDVSFAVDDGEMVCISGRSGSGKSTLLRQLSLIDKPTAGRVIFDGLDVVSLSESRRSALRLDRLGYVFQEYALIPELTAEENVFLPAMMRGGRSRDYHARARSLLELVGLDARVAHRPKELSGGEQQRVAIARALVNEPSAIYADEPTANLDSFSGQEVMQTLTRLNAELGVTILFVSHDPDDGQYASRMIHLRDGELVDEPEPAG
ncbi:ABC transporter ATP-binding protein [Lacisediminihabitans profunda]|uniref:ABC transporter ATP-binding protein n=1 Tax=Lacisediminihabitans profunda TaxID=2594790 RepID=A0A5C8UW79_9MICO|nr:ABC transporter ATP-binding protein [Lacisediminihabitans profunda]TXN31887.1 ABC transporter ATP-binding protein [Lacisediminihabitans profunda]